VYITSVTFLILSTLETLVEGNNKDKVDKVITKLISLKIEKDLEKLVKKLL
jgi:hypothetical protein